MYNIIKNNQTIHKDLTLNKALDIARTINEFVTISNGENDIVGVFGSRVLSDDEYEWKKRR